jgi:hypothetical protein
MSKFLKEAIADANELREAAISNAQSVLMESMKENVRAFVSKELDGVLNESKEVVTEEDANCEPEGQEEVKEGEYKMTETEDLDLDKLSDEEEGSEDEGAEEEETEEEETVDEGINESELDEAIRAALSEVDHGDLGDVTVMVNGDSKDPDGLADLDKKEEGWDKKGAEKSHDSKLATGEKYHQEAYKAKIANLVKENVYLKKANRKLADTVNEVKLFNAKILYTSKLLQREGLSADVKKTIVGKMDQVKSLGEAKNLYESLDMAFGIMSETKVKAKKAAPSLTEALVSGGASGAGKGISGAGEADHSVSRYQKLAGLKKDE